MMDILAQALNEDGLPGSGEIGYALPYYAFNHEDGVTPDIYDLSGRKVSGSLSPGVYIMAGKKVLVK